MWNTCREVFFFSACFSRGIRDDIEEEDDQVSSYAVFLSSFFLFVFFIFLPQMCNYQVQTKLQCHAQYPDNSAGSCSGYPPVSTILGVSPKKKRKEYQETISLFIFFYHLRRFFCQIEFQLPVLQVFQYLRVSSNLRLTESTNMEHH